MLPNNLIYEGNLWDSGTNLVAGTDEVGRGCIAGPLVAAAVVWPTEILDWITDFEHPHYKLLIKIIDSKKVSLKNRELLTDFIKENCREYSIVEIDSKQIDADGVGKCNIKALELAAQKIKHLDHVLVDHHKIFVNDTTAIKSTSITKGETHSISIAAASILAKVHRDNLMKNTYHDKYPQYGFDSHVGYGTKKHIEVIKKIGLSDIHRRSFCRNFVSQN